MIAHNFLIRDIYQAEGRDAVEGENASGGTWWALGWVAVIVAPASGVLAVLLGPVHLDAGGTDRLAAVLAFVGVLVTATVTIIGLALTRQANRRLGDENRVDFWSPDVGERISNENAILVVDAALRSGKPNAELVAAELLCRNTERLDPCQSLHWPSCIDGGWDQLWPKTKLLLVDALLLMTLAKNPVNGGALRSVAVRLYGIVEGDPDVNVRGCIATLIEVLLPALGRLKYKNFMQGNKEVRLSDLESAAKWAKPNDDDYLARIVKDRSNKLREWADSCAEGTSDLARGALGLAATNPATAVPRTRARRAHLAGRPNHSS